MSDSILNELFDAVPKEVTANSQTEIVLSPSTELIIDDMQTKMDMLENDTSKAVAIIEAKTANTLTNIQQEMGEDYALARDTLRHLVGTGIQFLDKLGKIAEASQHPRSYEVASTLITTVTDTADRLIELQKKMLELQMTAGGNDVGPSIENAEGGTINIFNGSTLDILDVLDKRRKEEMFGNTSLIIDGTSVEK